MKFPALFKTQKRRTKHHTKGRTINKLRETGHVAQHPTAVDLSPAEAKRCRTGPKGYCIVHTAEKYQIPTYGPGGRRIKATRSPRRRNARA